MTLIQVLRELVPWASADWMDPLGIAYTRIRPKKHTSTRHGSGDTTANAPPRGVSPSPGPYIITLVSSRVKFCPANLPATKAHMTSDYVSYVLGLQGWERALNEDNYYVYSCMAGEEDVT